MRKTVSMICMVFFFLALATTSFAQQNRGQRFRNRFQQADDSSQTDSYSSNRMNRQNRPSREQILKLFDANNDGKLDESERATARAARQKQKGTAKLDTDTNEKGQNNNRQRYQNKGDNQQRKPNREQILKRFDANNDGKLDESERATAKAEKDKMKAKILADFDANGNGKIDEDEKLKIREAQKQKRMAKIDTDGDGKISATEKAAGLKQHLANMQKNNPEQYNKLLERFDVNKDGELDEQEMENGRKLKQKSQQSQQGAQGNRNNQQRRPRRDKANDDNDVSTSSNSSSDTDLSFMDGI